MEPPADVLAGGRDQPGWSPPRWTRAPGVRLAAVLVVVGVVAVALTQRAEQQEPRPVDADLSVVGDAIAVSQGGVLVVPVALTNRGAALRLRSAELLAAPVRSEPLVTTPDGVPHGQTRRLAAIVDPDCTVIGPGIGGELVATLVVRVAPPTGEEQDLRLSLGDAAPVVRLLAGLCGEGSLALPAPQSADDERREVGLEARIDLSRG